MQKEQPGRIIWIDTLKAIGVILVIIGHTVGVPQLALQLIFSFHIPLFFWMSGLVSTRKVNTMSIKTFLWDRAQRRLIPYLSFALISYLLWVSFLRFFGTRQAAQVDFYIPLLGILYGSDVNNFLAPNVVLWFFPCLFMTELIYFFLVKIPSTKLFIAGLVICSLVGYWYTSHFAFRFPWGADIAFTAVVFYGVGYLSREYLLDLTMSRTLLITAFFSSLMALITFSLINTPVAIIIGNFGDNYLAFYLAAFAGIIFCSLCAKLLSGLRMLRVIGQQTLVLFSLHLLIFPFITGFLLYLLKVPTNFREQSVAYAILYTIITITLLTPVSILLEKHFPVLLGRVKKKVHKASLPMETEA